MTAVDRPDNGQDEQPWRVGSHYGIHVYKGGDPVATFLRPENAREAVDAVNAQIAGRAGAGEQQRVVAVIEEALWQREQFTLAIPDEPGHRLAWAAGAGPFIRGLADELLSLLGDPQPDGEA